MSRAFEGRGGKKVQCHFCERSVMISPGGQEVVETKGALVSCQSCAEKAPVAPDAKVEVTPKIKREVAEMTDLPLSAVEEMVQELLTSGLAPADFLRPDVIGPALEKRKLWRKKQNP